MTGGLLLLGLATLGGTAATWLFDARAPLYARLAMGATIGCTILAFAGFIAASILGLGPAALTIAALVALTPLLSLGDRARRQRIVGDLEAALVVARQGLGRIARGGLTLRDLTRAGYVSGLAVVIWLVSSRSFFEQPDGLYTANVNNLGDLPYHLGVTASFVYGANYPPQSPIFSGTGFSYYYMADFLAAMPIAAGASAIEAMHAVTVLLLGSVAALIHRWARVITGNAVAARLTPLIVLGSGGLGWLGLLEEARRGEQGIVAAFLGSEARYTISGEGFLRFGNAITTLLIPQRALLLGLGLVLIVLILLWQQLDGGQDAEPEAGSARGAGMAETAGAAATRRRGHELSPTGGSGRGPGPTGGARSWLWRVRQVPGAGRMLVAGLMTGILPIVHIYAFAVLLGTAFLLGLVFREWRDGRWRAWAIYVMAAVATALPTLVWTARDSSASLGAFLGIVLGWDHGEHEIVAFWVANAGPFILLLALAYGWDWERRVVPRKLLLYSLVFLTWFLVANVIRLAPWIWDNIKVLIFWYLGGAPVVALLLARFWAWGGATRRTGAAVLLFVLVAAGSLDIARATIGPRTYREWDRDAIAFAEAVRAATPPGAVMLTAPAYNSPILLTGRPLFMGYAGWLWSSGVAYSERERDLRAIYSGAADAEDLLRRGGIQYIVVGPQERGEVQPNNAFLGRFPVAAEVGEYRLLRVASQ